MSHKEKRSRFGATMSISILAIWLAFPCTAEPNSSSLIGAELDPVDAESDAGAEFTAGTSAGGSHNTAADGSAQDPAASASKGPLSKLQVHGFLTQAWADADFLDAEVGLRPPPPFGPGGEGPLGSSPTGNEISIGIPEDGTTNYRFLALQFRYEISEKDVFVVQFASRTLGESPIQEFEDDIELDWAFYERRLADHTRLRVGRVQIPFGIYNELRDVGTVLPFYRPAFTRYKEGSFTSETVDGLSLAHTFFPQSDWPLDLTVYAGEWESIEFFPPQPELSQTVRAKEGYGYQLWLNTPFSGIRIGTGLLSFEQGDTNIPLVAQERRDVFHASFDGTFGRFTLQAEWDQEDTDIAFGGLPLVTTTSNWYVLAGVRITEKFRIWGQLESAEFQQESMAFLGRSFGYTAREDLGVALNYFFTPALVFKAEYHTVDGESFNLFPDFSAGFLLLRPDVFSFDDGSYSIIALSVSF